jgi:hypothetical protein
MLQAHPEVEAAVRGQKPECQKSSAKQIPAGVSFWREAAVMNSEVMSEMNVGPDNAPTPAGFASAG